MRLPPTVLFHPDFDRRLRSCTESADPSLRQILFRKEPGKALAGLGLSALTAGGDFHPALRTSAVRHERPARKYAAGEPSRQARSAWAKRMVPCRRGGSGPRGTELAMAPAARIRFRFVLPRPVLPLPVNNCGGDELWTNESWLVDGLGTRLRRFRKSHHLIRDRPALIRGDRKSDPRDRRSDV